MVETTKFLSWAKQNNVSLTWAYERPRPMTSSDFRTNQVIPVVKDALASGLDPPPGQDHSPAAAFSSACTDLACALTNTSTDPDGTIASSAWIFGDGRTSTAASPEHTYATAGTYTVALTVTDDQGTTNTTSQQVTVTAAPPPNQPPAAAFSSACTDLACALTNASTDPDGTIASSAWNFGDGPDQHRRVPGAHLRTAGTYTVALTVTDDQGTTDTTSQQVTVTAHHHRTNRRPRVLLGLH